MISSALVCEFESSLSLQLRLQTSGFLKTRALEYVDFPELVVRFSSSTSEWHTPNIVTKTGERQTDQGKINEVTCSIDYQAAVSTDDTLKFSWSSWSLIGKLELKHAVKPSFLSLIVWRRRNYTCMNFNIRAGMHQ